MSSIEPSRRCRFATTTGVNVPARSRGTSISIGPAFVNTVFGLSVEDLSEGGGPFLGVEELSYLKDVYPGETLYARSEVIAKREAGNRPGFGIVTWHTRGANERGEARRRRRLGRARAFHPPRHLLSR